MENDPLEVIEIIQSEQRQRGEWIAKLIEKRRCRSNTLILFKIIMTVVLLTTAIITFRFDNKIENMNLRIDYANSWKLSMDRNKIICKIGRLEEKALTLEDALKELKGETTVKPNTDSEIRPRHKSIYRGCWGWV